jgi:hypothetical protein
VDLNRLVGGRASIDSAALVRVSALASLVAMLCFGGCTTGTSNACLLEGDPCSTDADCCNGYCDASGTCSGGACAADGELCSSDAECCTGFCDSGGACTCGLEGAPCSAALDCCSGYCDGTCG